MAVGRDSFVEIAFLPALRLFGAAVADEGSPLYSFAAFFFKVGTAHITGVTGTTLFFTGNCSVTDIVESAGGTVCTLVRR
ncbi:hypothetical protein [Clostridium sp. Marseille-P2415]|uniref:hypothetical protein n=1 Tax=Clostridium sp. Marseille-P2415 TaxID=1805471 RepID=UPI001F47CFAC|nr:hypothetical protein [Clostridium sp. Marseille-P2415]